MAIKRHASRVANFFVSGLSVKRVRRKLKILVDCGYFSFFNLNEFMKLGPESVK